LLSLGLALLEADSLDSWCPVFARHFFSWSVFFSEKMAVWLLLHVRSELASIQNSFLVQLLF
jgi:hypothetical protein